MLFGTERGLSIYDGNTFKNLNYSDGLGNGGILSIEVDGKNIWLGGTNPLGAFTLYNGTALKNFDIPQASYYQMHIKSIKKGEDGKIWFGDQIAIKIASKSGLFDCSLLIENQIIKSFIEVQMNEEKIDQPFIHFKGDRHYEGEKINNFFAQHLSS